MKKQFKIAATFAMMHCSEVITIEAGVFETDCEKLIESLNGSKGAKLIGEATKTAEPPKANTEPTGEDEQLLKQLQAEYLSKIGSKPHHKAGVDKLKALIADFDKQQDK